MSIASINLCPSITVQNLNVQSSGSTMGTYSNITQSNDLIPGTQTPNVTFISAVSGSTDPDIANSLILGCSLNTVGPPNIPILVMSGNGGGNVGNESLVSVEGDIQVAGDIKLQNLTNAQSLATDANGNIIQGTATSSIQKWQLDGSLFIDSTFGDTTVTGSPYAIIDNDSRVVTIFVNLVIIVASNRTNVSPAFSIDVNQNFFTQPNTQPGTLPPPSALFQSYASNLGNTIFFFNDISLCNISTNPITFANCQYFFSGYFVNAGLMNVSSVGTVSATTGQRMIYSGTIQYMF
jgi:hypothetical protein